MSEDQNTPIENFKEQIANSNEEVNENISQEQNIESTQHQTQNSQLQTENMEVHHHPHVEKKNFKEYLPEGLMIFLEVTMGFVAENIRENISETKSAHEYLESFRNDLLQ